MVVRCEGNNDCPNSTYCVGYDGIWKGVCSNIMGNTYEQINNSIPENNINLLTTVYIENNITSITFSKDKYVIWMDVNGDKSVWFNEELISNNSEFTDALIDAFNSSRNECNEERRSCTGNILWNGNKIIPNYTTCNVDFYNTNWTFINTALNR